MTPNDVLEHFGILGMKWGRKKSIKEKQLEDYSAKKVLAGKKPSELSNEELRKVNERLQLERTYSSLSKKEMSSGKKIVRDMLVSIAKEQAVNFIKSQVKKKVSGGVI